MAFSITYLQVWQLKRVVSSIHAPTNPHKKWGVQTKTANKFLGEQQTRSLGTIQSITHVRCTSTTNSMSSMRVHEDGRTDPNPNPNPSPHGHRPSYVYVEIQLNCSRWFHGNAIICKNKFSKLSKTWRIFSKGCKPLWIWFCLKAEGQISSYIKIYDYCNQFCWWYFQKTFSG